MSVSVCGERMNGERPNQSSAGASVLLVGLSADVFARVSDIVSPHGVQARTTSLAKLRDDTAKFKPFIVLVDAYLYDFDPQAFEKLARTIGAKLGIVSNVKDAENLVLRILNASSSSLARSSSNSTPAPRRQDFETAKYDAKTLHDALGRMGGKRPEFDTARYDAKTLNEALERMSPKRLEPQTTEPTRQAPPAKPEAASPQNAGSETVQYDPKTLEAMLEQVTAKQRR